MRPSIKFPLIILASGCMMIAGAYLSYVSSYLSLLMVVGSAGFAFGLAGDLR